MPCFAAEPIRPMPFLHCDNTISHTIPGTPGKDGSFHCKMLPAGAHPLPASSPGRFRAALTLIELLLTIAVLGIIAAAIIPSLSADIPARLTSAAQVVSSDLEYARSLAVSNNSKYQITFNTGDNYYYLRHSGTNTVLNTLPASPFLNQFDTADTQTTD